MNKKNLIKGTTLPVALFFSFALIPTFGNQGQAVAAVDIVQQQGSIKGTVVDDKGEPVIGANVLVVGTSVGTITDIDGVFKINAKAGAKLKITFIGYTEQVVVAQNNMRVVLSEDATTLQEVEIVAYGVQKKVTMTGAVASVKTEALTRTSIGSVSNVLGGQMAGLTTIQTSGEPGADAAEVFIRGKATWGDASPLIQVDGVERSMNDIDPNEIESISILKDASATAVFGVRGANGVILITTKRGREGKAHISFSTSASIQMPTKMVETANSYEYAMFYNQMMANDTPAGEKPVKTFSDGVIQKFRDGSDPIRFPSINWIDYIMGDATLQSQHNLNISGGTDKVRYFISAGAYTQGGLFNEFSLPYGISYQYRRFNYRSNLDIDVTKTTTISFNVAGNVNSSEKPRTSQGSSGMVKNIYYSTPFRSAGFVNDKLVYTTTDSQSDGLNLPFVGDADPFTYYGGGAAHSINNSLNADLILNQKLDFITKGLSFKLKGSYNSSFTINKNLSGGTEMTYTPVLQSDGSVGLRPIDGSKYTNVSYGITRGKSRNWYMEAALNYNHSFGDHNIGALVLYNQSKEYYPKEYSDVPRGYVGLVGRVTYDWKNRYMVEANMGYNGSENFAAGNRFALFPAASVGWVASEEKFWESVKPVISFLKLRASFGLVGNDKIGGSRFMYTANPYHVNLNGYVSNSGYGTGNLAQLQAAYGYLFGQGGQTSTVSLGAHEWAINNANVTWEKAFKQNYGVDINFLNDRLSATIEYYKEHRWDILLQDGTAPSMLGFAQPFSNLGEVNNWGWELSLKWNDKIGKDFRYYIRPNLTFSRNRLEYKAEVARKNSWRKETGKRLYENFVYVFDHFVANQDEADRLNKIGYQPWGQLIPGDVVYKDLDRNGVIDDEDRTAMGNPRSPELMFGIPFGFQYKNFDFSVLLQGATNTSILLNGAAVFDFPQFEQDKIGRVKKMHLDRWTPETAATAKYPALHYGTHDNNKNGNSSLFLYDASYLRLKNVEIGYNVSPNWLRKFHVQQARIYVQGLNLLTFDKLGDVDIDPETKSGDGASWYPIQKVFNFGIDITF